MPDIDHYRQLNLASFTRTRQQLAHVARHRLTARLIRSLWEAASVAQPNDADLLVLLVKLGWNNRSNGAGFESPQEWRNEQLAEYLGIVGAAGDLIADKLESEFPRFKKNAQRSVQQYTGIIHYYPSLAPSDVGVRPTSSGGCRAFGTVFQAIFSGGLRCPR
jgi:hypothetical protein